MIRGAGHISTKVELLSKVMIRLSIDELFIVVVKPIEKQQATTEYH